MSQSLWLKYADRRRRKRRLRIQSGGLGKISGDSPRLVTALFSRAPLPTLAPGVARNLALPEAQAGKQRRVKLLTLQDPSPV